MHQLRRRNIESVVIPLIYIDKVMDTETYMTLPCIQQYYSPQSFVPGKGFNSKPKAFAVIP